MGVAGGSRGSSGEAAGSGPSLRLFAWIGTLSAAAVAAAVLATAVERPVASPSWPGMVSLAVSLVVAGRLNVDFRHHGKVDSLDLFEAALTPAVFYLPAPTAVLMAAAGKALSQLWMRKPPVKAAFNVAQWAASAGAATLVFAALRPAGSDPLQGLPALAAAMVSAAAVNLLALSVLFRLLGAARPPGMSLLRLGYLTRTSAITAMNIATGMLVVLAASTAPAAIGLVLGPLLLAHRAGRGYTLEYTDSQRMASLLRATHALAAASDLRDGIAGYLTEVVGCFDARAADAVIVGAGEADLDVHRVWAARARPLPQSQAPVGVGGKPAEGGGGYERWTTSAGESPLLNAMLTGAAPALLPGHHSGRNAELLRAAGWHDCIAVPLPGEGIPAALLCVYDRSGSADFDASDLLILEALGRELTAALQRARLFDAVLDERIKLARIVNGTTDGIAALGADGMVLTWNPAFTALTGYGKAEMIGSSGLDRLDPRDADGRPVALAQWATAAGPMPADIQIRTASGPVRCLSCSYAQAPDPNRPPLLIVIARDVTELRRHQSLLASEAQVLELIAGNASLEASLAAVATMIRQEAHRAWSAIFLAVSSEPLHLVTAAALAAHRAPLLLAGVETVPEERWAESARTFEPVVILNLAQEPGSPAAAQAARDGLGCCWAMPIRPNADGYLVGVLTAGFSTERRPTDSERALLRTAARLAAIAVSRQAARLELNYQVSHDPLTGLPNRSLFLAHCVRALERAARDDGLVIVMFLDLDRFKFVNDSLGHDAGNRILVAVADRLRTVVRPADTVARFGGDEFTILCERIRGPGHARSVAERVRQIFETSFTVQGEEVFTTASIGIALGRSGHLAAELVENADAAMYRAKDRGGNRYEFFDDAMRHNARLRLGTYVALRNAVDRREFTVLYQPIVSLNEVRLVGVEALVRWRHPTEGLLPPVAFIELAEETGLIVPIGAQVLHESLCQLQRWQHWLPSGRQLRMNVNLSARQFTQPDLVQMIELALRDTGTPPDKLSIEITESVLVLETQFVQTAVSQLKRLGVGLTIDDFGTGHSSLTYLRRLPVDQLKVDRSFVAGMSRGEQDASIVSAVISLGHDLGLTVVAEGIETADQLRRLQQLRCDEAQGYYFGGPLSADKIMAMVKSGSEPWVAASGNT
jgi:diguanylate cyclase (GGDEF)-like protein/PAS domain S-box-containing protein